MILRGGGGLVVQSPTKYDMYLDMINVEEQEEHFFPVQPAWALLLYNCGLLGMAVDEFLGLVNSNSWCSLRSFLRAPLISDFPSEEVKCKRLLQLVWVLASDCQWLATLP